MIQTHRGQTHHFSAQNGGFIGMEEMVAAEGPANRICTQTDKGFVVFSSALSQESDSFMLRGLPFQS